MSKGWKYVAGEWQVYCDVCQKPVLASEAKHRWDGFIVCPEDYEERHPQDFIRVKPEKNSVPFTRPEPPDVFIEFPVNDGLGKSINSYQQHELDIN